MKKFMLFAEAMILALAFAQMAAATTWYVATNGAGNGTSWELATNNIQGAISLAITANDVVLVSNGVYQTGGITNYPTGSLLTNRVAITNVITVQSANNDPTNTIIKGRWDTTTNGPAAVRCVYMAASSKLIGFTITNGATLLEGGMTNGVGGGVWSADQSATVSNCLITGNSAYGGGSPNGGGGVYRVTAYNCNIIGNNCHSGTGGGTDTAVLRNCTLAFNYALMHGGGAWNSTLYNCLVISNRCVYRGGGMYGGNLYDSTMAYNYGGDCGGFMTRFGGVIRNCQFYGNQGHGVVFWDPSTMESCTIVGNSGYGIYQLSGYTQTNNILNCVIYSNQTANWGEIANSKFMFTNSCTYPTNVTWGTGNTTNNPVLVDFGAGYGTNHVKGNYRLQAISPCFNTGMYRSWMMGAVDLDGRTRIRYGTVDMGAYERINAVTIYGFH